MNKLIDSGFVSDWDVRDAVGVHPHGRKGIITASSIIEALDAEIAKGNVKPDPGFSAAIFLSELRKICEELVKEEKESGYNV